MSVSLCVFVRRFNTQRRLRKSRHSAPAVTCFQVWPLLATQAEIWDWVALMTPALRWWSKTTVLGRVHDAAPAGTAFGAIYDGTAMHAIETHAFRRQGLGRHMIHALAFGRKNVTRIRSLCW
jgi:hypothetical protein